MLCTSLFISIPIYKQQRINYPPNCRAIIFVGFVLASRALYIGGELKLRELDAGKLVIFRFVWLLVEYAGVVKTAVAVNGFVFSITMF
jgi:hypothetical protein